MYKERGVVARETTVIGGRYMERKEK